MGKKLKAHSAQRPNAIRRAYRKARGRLQLRIEAKDYVFGHKWTHRYKTASRENIKQFGKNFINSFPRIELRGKKRQKFVVSICHAGFEAQFAVGLSVYILRSGELVGTAADFAKAKLGFQKNAVIVENTTSNKGMAARA